MGMGIALVAGCATKTEPQAERQLMELSQVEPPVSVAARVVPQSVVQKVSNPGAEKILAENPRLSMEQAETVHQLVSEMAKNGGTSCLNDVFRKANPDVKTGIARQAIEHAVKDIDPILVGRNLVFGKEWLKFVGDNKPLSRQQFQAWVGRLETVYDSYEDLVGTKPKGGEKIFVHVHPPREGVSPAHAESGSCAVCLNEFNIGPILQQIRQSASTTYTVLHEMAHVFAYGREWEINGEDITNPLVSYAMEKHGLHYGGVPNYYPATKGIQHRQRKYNEALINLRMGRPDKLYDGPEAAYLLGLVDKVGGWDVYKEVFRSYPDDKRTIVSSSRLSEEQKMARSLDFFERIERVSGKPGVLRSMADRGRFSISISVQK